MTDGQDRTEDRHPSRGVREDCQRSGEIFAGAESEPTVSVSDAVHQRPVASAERVDSVGGYRILGVLGEGGMGVVYEAEQSSPARSVALKVMRRGHTVDEVHARMFHYEAQALARLRHPRIAAIYESGHTPDGHDFFAMELVRGATLGGWLEGRRGAMTTAELRARLRLFHDLCEPVHYAHQRGVIHRDLKPANIMVTELADDDDSHSAAASPSVKILDFGLARITDPDMAAATLISEVGAIRGTLPYMSPEQTRSDVDAVDVRTDVYALGVILYEMLTDRRPYDLDSSSLVNAVRIICESPPRPLNADSRHSFRLDADLETIVDKALAKEPDERYGTVAELADDVDRYLSSRPILARRPSAAYRLRKFVQRNRAGVAATAVVAAAVIAGVIGTAVGFVRARHAEANARREAATSAKVSQFLADMLATSDAEQVGRLILDDLEERVAESAADSGTDPEAAVAAFQDLTLRVSGAQAGRRLIDDAILSRAAAAIAGRFSDEPQVASRLEHTLAETYERFGLYESAMEHARRAVALREASVGVEAPGSLRSRALLGLLRYRLGEFSEAEEVLRETLERQRSLLGDDHSDVFWTSVRLSWVLIEQGQFSAAEKLLQEVLARQRRLLGDEHRDTATTMNSLAVVYADQQRYADAEALHSEVLAIRNRTLGPNDPDTLKSMTNLAVVSFYQGRFDDAAALFEEVLDVQTRTLGPDHPVTLASTNNLAVLHERQGRLAEAEALHRRALEAKIRNLGDDHPETLSSRYNLAILLTAQGHLDEAGELHQQILKARQRSLGPDHPSTLDSICAVAGVAALRGDGDAALRGLEQAIELGYSDADGLLRDADFESLRDNPEFLELIERARGDAASTGESRTSG